MGRLPSSYADRPILDRFAYELFGELNLLSAAGNTEFPPATFANQTDLPFEVHRMIPRFLALDSNGVALVTQPNQDLLASLIRLTIKMTGVETAITRVPTPAVVLTKGEAERTWEFADPMYLERSESFTVSAQGDTYPAIDGLSRIRVMITFEGFRIVIAPPTNNR